MNDREFIELLNLYVDHEISPEDALKLEFEVASLPERRKVYDQYCRIQKACAMLSEKPVQSAAQEGSAVVALPAQRSWRFVPLMAGMAAAAAFLVLVAGLRYRGGPANGGGHGAALDSGRASPVADTLDLPRATDSMKPVFFTRPPAIQPSRPVGGGMFADSYAQSQTAQLNWISDIHLAPVFRGSNPDNLLSPRPDLKTAVLNGPQNGRDAQEPAEMTAFRFQR
jgi:hypothetical protein